MRPDHKDVTAALQHDICPQHRGLAAAASGTMIELLRTNDLVLISVIETLLAEERIACFVADQHMSAVEGSLGFLPRRIMVETRLVTRARRLLSEAGFAEELARE